MACSNGSCAVENAPPRADGHCCDACAREAASKERYVGQIRVSPPLMRPVLARPRRVTKIRAPMETITVASSAKVPDENRLQQDRYYPVAFGEQIASAKSQVAARAQAPQLPTQRVGAPSLSEDTAFTFPWFAGYRGYGDLFRAMNMSMTCAQWQMLTQKEKESAIEQSGFYTGGWYPVSIVADIDRWCAAQVGRRTIFLSQRGRAVAKLPFQQPMRRKASGAPGGGGGGGGHDGGHGGHGGHGHGGFGGRGFIGGFYPLIQPWTYLSVMGNYPCAWWWRLSPLQKIAHAQAFEAANPGAIGTPADFVDRMDKYCLSQGMGYGPGYGPGYGYGIQRVGIVPAYGIDGSGDITVPTGLTAADWRPYGTAQAGTAADDLGNRVRIDSSGHPIQGTGTGADGAPVDDYNIDLASLYYFSSQTDTPNQQAASDPNVAAALRDVGTLLTAAGTDIQAVIQANDREELARINAQLQTSLATQRAANGAQLSADQLAQMRILQQSGVFTPQSQGISTPVAIGGGVIGLAILLKLLDVI